MATFTKRKSSAEDIGSGKPPRKRPAAKPFLRFYHSVELRMKTLSVLDAVEQAEDATAHRGMLADLVLELTDCGMDYFFMKPLKLTKAGFIVEQSAKLGLAGTKQVMGSVIRNIIGQMDTRQLYSVCSSIRRFMR